MTYLTKADIETLRSEIAMFGNSRGRYTYPELADHVAKYAVEQIAARVAAETRESVLSNLPVALPEFVRAADIPNVLIARHAQITEKHLSQMLCHGAGSIGTWVKVIHAVRDLRGGEENEEDPVPLNQTCPYCKVGSLYRHERWHSLAVCDNPECDIYYPNVERKSD